MILTEDIRKIKLKEKNSLQKRKFMWNLQKGGIVRTIWFTVNGKSATILIEEENAINVRNNRESIG